jgi:hypothetical protein
MDDAATRALIYRSMHRARSRFDGGECLSKNTQDRIRRVPDFSQTGTAKIGARSKVGAHVVNGWDVQPTLGRAIARSSSRAFA